MSDKKISELPGGGPLQATDLFPIARGGTNYSLAGASLILAGGGGGGGGGDYPHLNIRAIDPDAGTGGDDLATFNAAMAAIGSLGGQIDLPVPPAGKYLLSGPLEITKPIIWNGCGGLDVTTFDAGAPDLHCVIIEYTGASVIDHFVRVSQVRGCGFRNLLFDAKLKALFTLKGDRIRNSRFDNAGFINALGSGFILGGSGTIDDGSFWNEFHNCFFQGKTAFELQFFDGGTTGAYHQSFFSCRFSFRPWKDQVFTAAAGDANLTCANHGYAVGTLLLLKATVSAPGGLAVRTPYYVVSAATNTLQLSATRGGAAITPSGTGTGTLKFSTPGIALLSGDANSFWDTFVWNHDGTSPTYTDVGPGVYMGPGSGSNPYSNYNNHFDHILAQQIMLSPDALIPGVVYNYDIANGGSIDDPSRALTWTSINGLQWQYNINGIDATATPIQFRQTVDQTALARFLVGNYGTEFWSGNAAKWGGVMVGRAGPANDGLLVASGGGSFGAGDIAGDVILAVKAVGNALRIIDVDAAARPIAVFDTDTTAGNTRMLLYDPASGTVKRVSLGAADSGGAGFKVLRIPN